MNKHFQLLAYGDLLWDTFEDAKYIGGAPFNVAAHFAFLGGTSALISAVGKDALGDEALSTVKSYDVATDYIERNGHSTAQMRVTIQNGEPQYALSEDCAFDYTLGGDGSFSADVFYFCSISLRCSTSEATLLRLLNNNRFSTVFCDLNLRPASLSDKIVRTCLSNATILKLNREEVFYLQRFGFTEKATPEEVAKDIVKKYKKIKTVLITLDSDGSILYDAETESIERQKALPCKIVSTIGAGDAFSAAFIYSTLQGKEVSACLQAAAENAAFTLGYENAVPLIRREEL